MDQDGRNGRSNDDGPFYLRGNFAPVTEEISSSDLRVTGTLPASLNGLYVRNGPNPRGADLGHWFLGDGMLHGVRLAEGRALWFRNRWVRTRYLEDPHAKLATRTGKVDHRVAKANTHVIAHGARLFALVESSFPTEVDGELATLGACDFDGRLGTSFTAHPKTCPVTGELHAFGYGFRSPYLTYHVLDAAGRLVRSVPIAIRRPVMMHDFAITRGNAVFMDLPIVLDRMRALSGRGFPFGWSARHRARIGVVPREAISDVVRWFEIEPCFVFHVLNAHEDRAIITLDVVRYERLWQDGPHDFPPAHLHRYRIDLDTGTVDDRALDDRPLEFPRIDPRRVGLANRFGYSVETAGVEGDVLPQRIYKHDLQSDVTFSHDFGAGRVPGEPSVVPAYAEAGEDEAWLLAYVYDDARGASDLAVLDARRIEDEPVALVHLPSRVPYGFHGSWIADGELSVR